MIMLEDLPAMTKAEEDTLRLLQFFRNDNNKFTRNDKDDHKRGNLESGRKGWMAKPFLVKRLLVRLAGRC